MALVLDLGGPVGPFGSFERIDACANEVAAARPEWLLEGLLQLLGDGPVLPRSVSRANASVAVLQLLAHYRGTPGLVDRLAELLEVPAARETVIEALGETGDPAAVLHLVDAARRYALGRDELASLACAFGDLGGARARAALVAMRQAGDVPESVLSEITLALERSAAR